MRSNAVTRRLARSKFSNVLSFGLRVGDLVRLERGNIAAEFRWLFSTREHTNYTFDLSDLGRQYMATWVASITGASLRDCLTWFQELETDIELLAHIKVKAKMSPRRGTTDTDVRFGRRLAWYAIVRATRPQLVVETGTDKGLGSLVLASALLRNGAGRLTTVDINPESGALIGGKWSAVIHQVVETSASYLPRLQGVDLFIHDSDHSYENESREYISVTSALSSRAMVISDCAHESSALFDWSQRHGRQFLYCHELLKAHWFPGGGVGTSLAP